MMIHGITRAAYPVTREQPAPSDEPVRRGTFPNMAVGLDPGEPEVFEVHNIIKR
jgi:hypothetical protein